MSHVGRADYMMGRDVRYAGSCTPEIEANAARLLVQVNQFLEVCAHEGIPIGVDEHTHTCVASGFRPPAVNDRTSNAGASSTHLAGLGIDLRDTPDRDLARFALVNAKPAGLLEELGLYMERPQWTPTWVHLQLKAPHSGRRVYVPSMAPAMVALLAEEEAFA